MTPPIALALLERADRIYNLCWRIGTFRLPYVFSGGHNSMWLPSRYYSVGIADFQTAAQEGAGLDCSAACSIADRAGGMVWAPRPPLPLATGNYMEYGRPGDGIITHFVTSAGVGHMALHFAADVRRKLPPTRANPHARWREAEGVCEGFWQAESSVLCGFNVLPNAQSYMRRHWPGLGI